MAVLADTGALYALADGDDRHHKAVKKYVQELREALVVPSPVIPETCYLLLKFLGPKAEIRFLRSLADQELLVEHFTVQDIERTVEILADYQQARFGMVDAAVMAMAERLKVKVVLTVDRRDFSLYRPRHCEAFQVVPE